MATLIGTLMFWAFLVGLVGGTIAGIAKLAKKR